MRRARRRSSRPTAARSAACRWRWRRTEDENERADRPIRHRPARCAAPERADGETRELACWGRRRAGLRPGRQRRPRRVSRHASQGRAGLLCGSGKQSARARRRISRDGRFDAQPARRDARRGRLDLRRSKRRLPQGGAVCGDTRLRGRGVPRGSARHGRRGARDECGLLRIGNLGRRRESVDDFPRREAQRASAGRFRRGLSPRRAARIEARRSGMVRRRLVPFPRGRREARPSAHQGAARAAHRHAAARAPERRFGVPQPARGPCRAADRGLRPQGPCDRRGAHIRKAREFHRQPEGQGVRGRHRGADRARAQSREGTLRRRADSRSENRRGGPVKASGFGKVAVLMGGRSAERPVSLKSGSMVLAALKKKGVSAHAFDPKERGLDALIAERFDRAFIALHGRYGEDGTLQGARELLIHSSEFHAVAARLGLPLMVKPANEGSSIGMTKVKSERDLPEAYALAANYDRLVIAEAFVDGVELTAGMLGDAPLPLVKLETPREFYDYEAKYVADDTRYVIPCGLPPDAERIIQDEALRAFRALACSGWGRVDLMLDRAGKPYFLEVNTSPGMTDHSLVPMAARHAGLSFEDLCLRILELARLEGEEGDRVE